MKVNQNYESKSSGQLQKVLNNKLEGDFLKDLKDGDIANLLKKLYIMIGVGEHNILTGEENNSLVYSIKSEFGNWTKQEIIYAFQLAIKGQLINVELSLYDKPFNTWYLSKILNQYKIQFRSKALAKHNQKIMDENEQKELTPDQKQKIIINGVLTCFERYKQKKKISDGNNITCKFLIKLKLIDWTKLELKELVKNSIEARKQELILFKEQSNSKETRKYFNDLLLNFDKNMMTSKTSQANLNRIYFILSLEKYFNELIEFDINLEELIKNKIK